MTEMRRKDREMSREFGISVIDKSPFGVLAVLDQEGKPYTVPLSIVREQDKLYFHSAKAGKKVDLLKDGSPVSISFVAYDKVPNMYSREEVMQVIEEGAYRAAASKIYTTEFASAHVEGRVYRVEDQAEAAKALQLVCNKFTPDISDLAPAVIENSVSYTAIFRVEIDAIKAKRKAFDKNREEMKFQRME